MRSKNRHGIHSPYVYHLLDEVVYDSNFYEEYLLIVERYNEDSSSGKLPTRFCKLLYRLSKHFKPNELIFFNDTNRVEASCLLMVESVNGDSNTFSNKTSIIYVDEISDDKQIDTKLMPLLTEMSFFIIKGIHSSLSMNNAWHKIIQHSTSTVTIDLFYIGLVFHRPGQVKENFKIRF